MWGNYEKEIIYYNYDINTGKLYEEGDPNYVDFDYYQQEMN